jgi:hypothetical protein
VEASTSLNYKIKTTLFAKRIPKSSATTSSTTNTTTKHYNNILSSARESISQHANAASNQLLKSASSTLSQSTIIESASQRAIKTVNQLQDVTKKTMRWLWWWGLAAVGIYGISTTLTKEGIHMLKEFITTSSNEKLTTSSSSAVAGETGLNYENNKDAMMDYYTRGNGDCV